MFALVENNEFVKILNDRKGFIGTADNIEIVWEDRTRTVNITDEEGNDVLWTQEEIDNGDAPEGTQVDDIKTREETYKESTEVTTQQEVKYSKDVFTKWSNAEREAIGVYEVQVDNTNKKDEAYYINTDISYSFDGSSVIGSYGIPTPKPLSNILFTQADADANEIPEDKAIGDVKQYGLKEIEIFKIKSQAGSLLAPTDWYVIRHQEDNTKTIPTNIATYRNEVRAKSDEMESQINACGTVEDLQTLLTWVYDENTDTNSRPLVEFPFDLLRMR
jgi:hypothetical protein